MNKIGGKNTQNKRFVTECDLCPDCRYDTGLGAHCVKTACF